MLPTEHLLAFVIASAAVIAVPGPSVLFTITRSLTLGRQAGVATVAGNAAGVYLQVIAVAIGLGAVVERSATLFTVIKLAGAAYLVFLGVQAVRHRYALRDALGQSVDPKSLRRILRDGVVVGLMNPKSIVFFAAVLPQFVDPSAGAVPQQLLLLGAMFVGLALVLDSAWAVAAGTARAWLVRSPRRLELIGGAGGVTMIGLGVGLALSGRKH
jgi:threonine/homoserine/homoserine lactone efflux protein